MERSRITNEQQFSLDRHAREMGKYEDPILESREEWEHAGNTWVNRIRFLLLDAQPDDFDFAEEKLATAQQQYTELFHHTASLLGSDTPDPDLGIKVITTLVSSEDTRLLKALSTMYLRFSLPEASAEYIHDIAKAYGDPHGKTIMPDTQEVILTQSIATESFNHRISGLADRILDTRRQNHANYLQRKHSQSIGQKALNLFRRARKR